MPSGIRPTHQEVKNYFEQQGCQLLEDSYKNARTKLRYCCSCGEESKIVFDSFKRGNRCRKCGNRKAKEKLTLTTYEVGAYFQSQGCELLDDYKSNLSPMKYRCSCGRQGVTSWNNFKVKGRRCRLCGFERRSGENHYDWRPDRQRALIEYRFKQCAYRTLKQLGVEKPFCKVMDAEKVFGYGIELLEAKIVESKVMDDPSLTWEIDHIFPVWAFVEAGIKDPKVVNAIDNLQILPKIKNRKKCYKFNPVAFVSWVKSKGVLLSD